MTTPRVVFDCNTLLQALASPGGPAGRCLQLAFDGRAALFASEGILGELREVTTRPKLVRKLRITPERIAQFVEALELGATILTGVPEIFHYARDEDDAHYINVALAAEAQLIVSWDRDLLDLMDVQLEEGRAFVARFPELSIVTPVRFLGEVEGEDAH